MDANSMSPAELRKLADRKEQESQIIACGFLKCDLYYAYDIDSIMHMVSKHLNYDYLTKDKIAIFQNEINKYIESKVKVIVPKGTKYHCYIRNGEELWFDTVNYGITMSAEWALEHLEGITSAK